MPEAFSVVKRKRQLSYVITLRDGRKLSTVAEAVAVMLQLPVSRQHLPVWEKTMQMLLEANETGKPIAMRHATAQLVRALQVEGWMV